ncbi:hypothetical protein J437_LFUL018999 [Ladona fulva]|uniref:Uncharacterized protein n=1 Tax=Ladona fulva TaxID=123851 RepID=A0A8K0PAT1_LADFU|nr:hypothetical protein J437_LFUL018999 [Ladona fulva]
MDRKGAKVNVKNKFDTTPLHLAAQNGYLDTVEYLINVREADLTDKDIDGNNPLLLAAQNGHLDIVKFLIDVKKADIDVMNIYSCNSVLLASANGHLHTVKYLVDEKNMDYNVRNRFHSTPLHFAAMNGHLDTVKYLIDVKGAEVNVKNMYGFTPLHLASNKGHLDTVKYLVEEKNVNINLKSIDFSTPMHLAAQGGHLDILRYLIDVKGADSNAKNVFGSTPLHFAAQNGHLDTVQYLVDETQAKVNVKDIYHSTPILLAAQNGHLDILKYLINEKKGDFNIENEFGTFPVHLAAQNGHLDVLKYLIDENSDSFNKEDNDRNTPLHLAASNGHFAIVKYLINEKNANFNVMDVDNCTPLHLAALNGHLNIVKYLIDEKHFDFNVKNVFHATPVSLASLNGHLNTLRYLIDEKNADFHIEDIYGRTSLHLASVNGHLDTIKYLIYEKGTDVNVQNTFGATPIYLAAQNGHIGTVKYLIDEKNADVDVHDIFGNTPLHWATQSGNVDTVKYLLQNAGDILERKNQNDETALHWAAKVGYPDVIEFLLVKNANPNVQDKNGKTPLDFVQEKFSCYQEDPGFGKIIGLLRNAMDSSKSEDQEEQVSAKMSLEACIPGSSSVSRRKREAKFECLFTWEDMDEFNTEVDEKRSVSKIKIDSEKFINYIQELTDEKRRQLIGLAEQVEVVGKSQSLVNKLISNEKVMGHLNKVGRVSAMAMHGMMAKNALADLLNGNYQGVAFNVGFIAGGQGFAKVAQAASIKGLEIASEGKLLLGRSLKLASPFLARGTSAFVIYDLVNQVKEFRNGTEEALVGIVGDGIYLGVDSAEIGVEVAEAFEILEGVSSVTGPISAAIGAAVFIGTDIYRAVRRVERIDHIIHLKASERFIEGLRAFIGMKPEKHIEEFMEEKQLNNELVMQGLEYLQRHGDIRRYVFPTGKSVAYCHRVPYTTTKCVISGFSWCSQMRKITSYTEKCTTKFAEDLDNTVLLSRKRNGIKLSRAKPDDPRGGYLFCLPQGDSHPVPSYGSYLCDSAIGLTDLSSNKTGSYTLINLGKGEDYAEGLMDSPNIFVVNDGLKSYHGGNEDDTFILQGDQVKGYLSGRDGINTLDLTGFAPNLPSVDVVLDRGHVIYDHRHILQTFGMNKVVCRKNKSDRIFSACETQFLDGRGGAENNPDVIVVENKNCTYKMQMTVRPNTVIHNCASKGNFYYYIPYALGSAKINFLCSNEAVDSNNTFTFEYKPIEIKNIDLKYVNVPNKTFHVITFNFSPMSDKEFNVTISGAENSVYRFGNNTEIKVGSKGNLYLLQNTYKTVDEIIRSYLDVANRLNKMSFFIQSLLCNETVVIGSGNQEVIHNNPLYKSHLVGNGGENVYVIDSVDEKLKFPIPEVHIYDLDVESSVDTIDLRNLVQQARRNYSDGFELQVLKSGSDLLLKAAVSEVKSTDDLLVRKQEYFTVRLKDGVNWYKKTHVIIDIAHMKISFDEKNLWSLKPLPLKVENNIEVVVITAQDVEENTELLIPRKAGNYMFVRGYRSDLMITNAFDPNISKVDRCTIVLNEFYEEPKLETLSIKFSDKEVVLREHHRDINRAMYLSSMKKKHQDEVYKEVFGSKAMIPEVVMLSDQPVV